MIEVEHQLEGPADGEVVVLSNSLGADVAMWDAQVPALVAEGYRVLRYDMRGHGRSPAPDGPSTVDDLVGDLLGLLDRLGIAQAHLVGVSLGGMVSMATAVAAPARVRSLAPCFTAARLGPPEMWAERAQTVREHGTEALADAVVARWVTPAFAAREPERTATLRAMIAATSDAGYASCCSAIGAFDLVDRLGAISARTLVVAGAHDPATPPALGAVIASGVPGARLLTLETAHLGNIEQPAAYNVALLAHLGGRL